MTLQDLYTRVASLIGSRDIADNLCNATFLKIDNQRIAFKTFIETEHQASAQELNTEYTLPKYILLWKMKDSMWFMEGADAKAEFNAILKAKTDCREVTNIIRVDSDSEVIEIVRDSNKMISIDEVFRKKRRKTKGRNKLILLPS